MIRLLLCALVWCRPLAGLQAAETATLHPLTVEEYATMPSISAVHYSPDGARIAYVLTRANFVRAAYDGEIHVLNSDGSNELTLTHSTGSDYRPRWSPEGKRIAFISDRGGRPAIYTINVDVGEASLLTEEPTAIRDFEWSPDGRTIVFTRTDEAKEKEDVHVIGQNTRYSRLYAIDVDSHRVRRLTDGPYTVNGFSISP